MLTNNWIGRLQYDHYEFSSNTYLVPAMSNVSDTNVETKLDTVGSVSDISSKAAQR